ncbi:porin [Ramlibacter sp.]|uniref:porin n=1 Tax=Ramlibacter sp. TaxID=1917967 RepID=UPI002BBD27BF|nr:porin [Ramlibacter sp.]HWI83333.1 porin [Ramlibacter sp.]
MKKSLIALAVLAAAGAASAQSSVTLFGIVDATVAYGRASGTGSANKWQLTNSGYNSSRLGFRGVEDLGGGMSASFWLEAGLSNDNGTGVATNLNNQATGAAGGSTGLVFNRRSTVSLAGGWGELRLGRDYTPQFWNLTVFDPFGTNGVGTTQTLNSIITGVTAVRASNTIGYFLPGNLGGFYGQAQYYLGENVRNGAATEKDGTGAGVRLGFANGPFNVALALSRTDYATGKVKQNNLGGQWDFGIAKAMAHYSFDSNGNVDGKGWLIGGLFPVGAGEIRAAYSRYKTDVAGSPRTNKIALGYVHNLSKRTAVYTTWARVKNQGGAAQALNGSSFGTGVVNQNSSGLDLGIRHSF